MLEDDADAEPGMTVVAATGPAAVAAAAVWRKRRRDG